MTETEKKQGSESTGECKSCPACCYEEYVKKNQDHPFDTELLEKLAATECQEVQNEEEQIGDMPETKTPRVRQKSQQFPIYTQTFFKDFISKYQLPKRCIYVKSSMANRRATPPPSALARRRSNSLPCDSYLEHFIAQIKQTNSEDRQMWMLKRLRQKVLKNQLDDENVTNADREFIYAETAMEFFWMQSEHHSPKPPKDFEFVELYGEQDLTTFTPGTHWHTILKSRLQKPGDENNEQYQNDLRNLIKCWCSCCTRLLMKDFSQPGLIENCVERKVNFNNVTFIMLKNIFGVIPEFPGPFKPATLLEAFVLRLTYEARRLQKFENEHNVADAIELYFKTKFCTYLNYSLKAYFKACRMIGVEEFAFFDENEDLVSSQVNYV